MKQLVAIDGGVVPSMVILVKYEVLNAWLPIDLTPAGTTSSAMWVSLNVTPGMVVRLLGSVISVSNEQLKKEPSRIEFKPVNMPNSLNFVIGLPENMVPMEYHRNSVHEPTYYDLPRVGDICERDNTWEFAIHRHNVGEFPPAL